MKTRYYLGWFNSFFPVNLSRALQEDIKKRESIVMISSNPSISEEVGAIELSWLDLAEILFDDYYLINYEVQKEDAKTLILKASVIFLLGGDTVKQNEFLKEYEMSDSIKESNAVVLGASAGAINMSAKWICSKNFGYKVEDSTVYDGIGIDDFSVISHFDLENNLGLVLDELSSLSKEINIYASNKDCAVRLKGDKIDILGDVFLISHSKLQKMDETI